MWHRTALITAAALAALAFDSAAREPAPPATREASQALLKPFQDAGKSASITVLPTLVAGRPIPQVGNVVGMLLERGGMSDVQTSAEEFRPSEHASLAQTADALGAFVKAHPFHTEYILFNDFQVSPQRKFTEVRSIVVDRAGGLVWEDAQTAADADFRRIKPAEPMECCLLAVERLRPILALDDPTSDRAPPGKLVRRWEKDTGIPDEAENSAMDKRLAAFKKAAAGATLLIFPVRVGDAVDSTSATHLAKIVNQEHLARAQAAEQGPLLDVKPSVNEQKVLWSMARRFREAVRQTPPEADYVLYADYLMDGKVVGAVHFVVCDRRGDWVIVDYQNSHHEDFQAVKPASATDCDRLVARRLQSYCR